MKKYVSLLAVSIGAYFTISPSVWPAPVVETRPEVEEIFKKTIAGQQLLVTRREVPYKEMSAREAVRFRKENPGGTLVKPKHVYLYRWELADITQKIETPRRVLWEQRINDNDLKAYGYPLEIAETQILDADVKGDLAVLVYKDFIFTKAVLASIQPLQLLNVPTASKVVAEDENYLSFSRQQIVDKATIVWAGQQPQIVLETRQGQSSRFGWTGKQWRKLSQNNTIASN